MFDAPSAGGAGGAPGGGMFGGMPMPTPEQMAQMQSMFGGGGGGGLGGLGGLGGFGGFGGGGAPPAPADARPAHERFAVRLLSLQVLRTCLKAWFPDSLTVLSVSLGRSRNSSNSKAWGKAHAFSTIRSLQQLTICPPLPLQILRRTEEHRGSPSLWRQRVGSSALCLDESCEY